LLRKDLLAMWLLKLISYLPFSALYRLSDFLYLFVYRVMGYRKKMVRKNLANSFPEKPHHERLEIEKSFYKNLCDYAVETIKLLTLKEDVLKKRMVFVNPELLQQHILGGQSAILLSSHHFNWEWLLVSWSIRYPPDFVYQAAKSSFFNFFVTRLRTRFGAHPIERNCIARELVRRKTLIRAIAVVADQYPGQGNDQEYNLTFLNQPTAFFYGSQRIAELTQNPVLYTEVTKIKRGHYSCTFVPIGNPPYTKQDTSVVHAYAKAVERATLQSPSLWLWSHNRWKKKKQIAEAT
jgi:Kdo2-lipid IVA lauroyltransferase/acyltransferase